MTFLLNYSVRCKVVCCLVGFSEASLIFRLFLVKHWLHLPYRIVENSLYNAGNDHIGRQLLTFSTSPFLCITFIVTFFQSSGVNSFLFIISLKMTLEARVEAPLTGSGPSKRQTFDGMKRSSRGGGQDLDNRKGHFRKASKDRSSQLGGTCRPWERPHHCGNEEAGKR